MLRSCHGIVGPGREAGSARRRHRVRCMQVQPDRLLVQWPPLKA
jgi:hypothetical protein